MRDNLLRLAETLDAVSRAVGQAAIWIVLAMMLTQIAIVGLLFIFSEGSLWLQESILYMHAAYIGLLLGYALLHDAHVRIDIFYREAGAKRKALVNGLGAIFFLTPFCLLIVWTSLPYVAFSWQIGEGSREASGIQAVYLLKTLIPIAGILLGAQGIAMAARAAISLSPAPAPAPAPRENP